jgi:PAS domain S-box-containing protein
MEQALSKSEAGLARAQSKAHIGNWESDLATGKIIWSDEAYRIFGHTPRSFGATYDAFLSSVHPEDREKVVEAARQSVDTHQPYLVEHRVVRMDGEERIVQEQGEVLYSELDVPLKMLGVVQDVTEQRRAEAALKASEEEARMLALVARYTDNSVIVTDAHSRIVWVNDGFTSMTGYSFQEAVGLKPGKLLQGRDSDPAVMDHMHRCMLDKQGFVAEMANYRKSGELFWVSLSVTPISNGAGEVTHWISIESDITLRKTSEEALQQTQKLESLGLLAGGIAHDFNNLLSAIRGNVDLARMRLEATESPDTQFNNLLTIVERASGLTRQLLSYAGKGTVVARPMDFNAMIQENAALLSVSLPKLVQLDCRLAGNLPSVMGDAAQLQQVVMNLVINAGDAIGDRPGDICMTTSVCELDLEGVHRYLRGQPVKSGPQVVLEVSDSGCGMTPEVAARIFDPFYTTKSHGRGLGLSTMLGILRSHHAGIQVESVHGAGTTFRVFLPAMAGIPVREEVHPSSSVHYSGRALVADDDPDIRATSVGLLESLGFMVAEAQDGLEAVERFRNEGPFQVVLMDVLMPKANGFMACKLMAPGDPEFRIIHCSGSAGPENHLESCLACGLCRHHAFLAKPFGRCDLQRSLAEVFTVTEKLMPIAF